MAALSCARSICALLRAWTSTRWRGSINPNNYTITESDLYALMRKYGVLDEGNRVLNADWNLGVNMWLLDKGPCVVRDTKAA